MHSAAIAEWILRWFVGKSRAVTIIGDLVEDVPEKGMLWFWAATFGTAFSLGWRQAGGFIAAYYVGKWIFRAYWTATFAHTNAQTPSYLSFAVGGGQDACMLLAYAALRYGWRDRLAQIAGFVACIAAVTVYGWRSPAVATLCGLLLCAAGIASARRADRQNAALALGILLAVGWVIGVAAVLIDTIYGAMLHVPWEPLNRTPARPSVAWVGFVVYLGIVWSLTSFCGWVHRRLLGPDGPDLPGETALT